MLAVAAVRTRHEDRESLDSFSHAGAPTRGDSSIDDSDDISSAESKELEEHAPASRQLQAYSTSR